MEKLSDKPRLKGALKSHALKNAFSLVELLIGLIILSLLLSAFIPLVTKKLKASDITIGSFLTTTIKDDNCLSFNTNDDCTSCKVGYNLENGVCYPIIANCKTQVEGTCNSCNTGYILSNNACYPIVSNCKTQTEDKCSACNSGYTLGSDGKCTLACSCTNGTCSSGKNYCTSCNTGYILYDNKCVEGSETNCYDFFCAVCTSTTTGTCTACKKGYTLYQGKCYFGTLDGCNSPTYDDTYQVIHCSSCASGYTLCNSGSCRLSTALDADCPANTRKVGCTCVAQYNIGDGKYGENLSTVKICAPGTSCTLPNETSGATANTQDAACWDGSLGVKTAGVCNDDFGGYSGCYRTMCNWRGGYEMCNSIGWRLPTLPELIEFTNINHSSATLAENGLMFCDKSQAYAKNNAPNCDASTTNCKGGQANYCYPYQVWSSTLYVTSTKKYYYRRLNGNSWANGSDLAVINRLSVRCVKDL